MPDPEIDAEETAPEVTHDGFIALDKHQKDVNVQHKRFRDEERGRVKEQTRADSLQVRVDELEGKNAKVVVPDVPDRYSETYEADIAARDQAIAAKADQDAADANADAQRREDNRARVAGENLAIEKRVVDFDSNMVAHGLKPAEVKLAADTVIGYGISNEFQDVLLEDTDGPLLVQYLAANPVEADAMNRMTPTQRFNHINSDVRAKALLLKPRTSDAPDPPIVLDGGGAPETKADWEAGAKYE